MSNKLQLLMFVVIADVEIKPEFKDDFKKWFSEANKTVSKFDGYISRKLLEARDGKHRIMVEFEDMNKFRKMHQSKEHDKLHAKAVAFMEKLPLPKFYNVVAE